MKRIVATLSALIFCVVTGPARADEGMWTFDAFPSAKVRAAYGFGPSQAWLDHVRESSLRSGGCSASFVSANGLVMTNHHCAVGCVEQLSSQGTDYVQSGFYAKSAEEEKTCPGFELNRLDRIDDVTAAVQAALAGKTGRALIDAQQAVSAKLSATCGTSESIHCDLVTLYHGGQYKLYHYTRFNDVRLVFAPEFAVGQFGGDPDNFNFPRYGFDCAFLRVYVDGKPVASPQYLHWNAGGSKAGDLVFVSGNPGSTQRLLTNAQLAYIRDVQLPKTLVFLAELRGLFEQYQTGGAEEKRQTNETLFFIENSYKALLGRQEALVDPQFFARKIAEERTLRGDVAKRPALASTTGDWDELARVQVLKKQLATRYGYVGQSPPFSQLFSYAQTLVSYPAEKAKPDAARLPEFSEARAVLIPRRIEAAVPVYPGPETIVLGYWAKKMREDLGPDDAFVKQVLGDKSPAQWASDIVAGTKLADPAVRKALIEGGAAAVDASTDPMIVFARSIDPEARRVRKEYEDRVQAPEDRLGEAIARARFAILGTTVDPDATFTARLSYGTVKGFVDGNGKNVVPYTTIGGLYGRATGSEPYALPQSWLAAKSALDPATAMNLCTTNDIIGGNSGSPLVDTNGTIVGLIFDGNIFSLGGAYGYDGLQNRAVAVDSRAILAGLQNVYHADRIVSEITTAK